MAKLSRSDAFKRPPRIGRLAKRIAAAANTAINSYARAEITDEPEITNRWTGAVVSELELHPQSYGHERTNVSWRANTLRSSSGVAAEEKRHGADILGVAEIWVGSQVIRKGFLGQAKRSEPGAIMDQSKWDQLQAQITLMLSRTPASFVLVYSTRHGITFIPAISVGDSERQDLFNFNCMDIEEFFKLHLACFIGDRRLSAPHISRLDQLLAIDALDGLPVEHILRIVLSYKEE